jgi:hypothetical protein
LNVEHESTRRRCPGFQLLIGGAVLMTIGGVLQSQHD